MSVPEVLDVPIDLSVGNPRVSVDPLQNGRLMRRDIDGKFVTLFAGFLMKARTRGYVD
jgi:hypothetical protein